MSNLHTKLRFFNTYEPVAPFFRGLAPFLARQGHRVDLVVSAASYRAGQPLREYLADEADVHLVEAPALGSSTGSTLGKLVVVFAYLMFAVPYSLFGPRADLNIFLTQPPLFGMWGYLLKRLRRQPYVLILQDLYPHLLVELGFIERRSWRARIAFFLGGHMLRDAENVVVIGRCMKAKVLEMGVAEDRICVVSNWADHEATYPVAHNNNGFREAHGWQEKFVVMYAGNIGYPQSFDDFLAAAARLSEDEDILFAFVGGGGREAHVKAAVAEASLRNVVFLPFMQREYSLAEIVSAGDVQFVTLRDECTGLAVPSKAYGALAAARPIVYQGAASGEIALLIGEESLGAAVGQGEPEQLADAFLQFAREPQLWADTSSRAQEIAARLYDGSVSTKALAEVLVQAASSRRADAGQLNA